MYIYDQQFLYALLILLCGTVTEDMLGHYSEGFMGIGNSLAVRAKDEAIPAWMKLALLSRWRRGWEWAAPRSPP